MWILGPLFVGVLATVLMGGTCWAKALGHMAGGPLNSADFSLMYFVAIPAAFVSGFLARRRGFIRALIGCIIYLSPISYFCLSFSAELRRDGLIEAATAILKVPILTSVFATFAAFAFAAVTHVNKQTREKNAKALA